MEGARIEVVATPASGYEIDKITYTPEGGSEVDITADAAFAMPAANVVVNAEFRALPPTEPLELVNGPQQTWLAGAPANIGASVANLADALGEVVVAWEWQYSKTPDVESSWTKSGAALTANGAECALTIPECTSARKPPMAWRVKATTNLGRTATGEPQSLRVPEGPALKPTGEFAWVAGRSVEIAVTVEGLDVGETVVAYRWYYSKDGKTFKRSGAVASQSGIAGERLSLAIPSCTEARKPPMAWSVRITTSTGRIATSEGISLSLPGLRALSI